MNASLPILEVKVANAFKKRIASILIKLAFSAFGLVLAFVAKATFCNSN